MSTNVHEWGNVTVSLGWSASAGACAALDRAVHPTTDGQGIETVFAGRTNDIPAAALASGVAWLASELCGVAVPATAAAPVVLAIIAFWAWRRKRRNRTGM